MLARSFAETRHVWWVLLLSFHLLFSSQQFRAELTQSVSNVKAASNMVSAMMRCIAAVNISPAAIHCVVHMVRATTASFPRVCFNFILADSNADSIEGAPEPEDRELEEFVEEQEEEIIDERFIEPLQNTVYRPDSVRASGAVYWEEGIRHVGGVESPSMNDLHHSHTYCGSCAAAKLNLHTVL
ncbi:hypothetical protein DFH27DRAFT_602976 [Peziza echinospora]|nr:hypothetical protein DFH27DRAFT_602976 [Peziza echinospora]